MRTKSKKLPVISETKHFCILPWIHFHAWPDKRIMPCCIADSNMPVSSTDKDTVLDMMNTPEYNDIRLKMLNDEYVDVCKRCYDLEDMGIWSMRQSNNARRYEQSLDLVRGTNSDGSIKKFKLKYLDIRFSNICNMKCRTCGPACSSRWAEEFVKMQGKSGKQDLKNFFKMDSTVVNANDDGTLLDKLKPHLLDVEEVYFAGGESLITNEHYDVLDYWIENNHTNVELTYTTNLLTLRYKNKHAIEYWEKFPNVQIWASVDGKESVLELLRHGSEWKQIHKNLADIKKYLPHVKLGITPTISIYNVFSFPEFHRELIEEGLIDETGLRLNILTYPQEMNIGILPREIAMKLEDKWWSHYHWLKSKYPIQYVEQLTTVCSTLEKTEANIDLLKEFFTRNKKYDILRNEFWYESIPELTELYLWLRKNS